jgi:type I restriction enzyme S subunit
MNNEREFKNLPEGWKWVRLGEVVEEVKERNLSNDQLPLLTSSRKGIYLQDEYFNRIVASENLSNYKVIRKGQFTYRSMSEDETFVFNRLEDIELGLVSPAYYIFQVIKGCSGSFLKYFINNSVEIKKQIYKYVEGTTRTALRFNQLKNFIVPLPPLPEQQKIAEILETIDNSIEKTDKIIEKYKRIKQGLMQDLLTKGIDENGNIRDEKTHKFKDSPLGKIPEEWEVVRLGEVVHSFAGGTPNREIAEFYNGGIKWLKSGEINRKYIFFTEETLSPKGLKSSNAKWVPENTVVIAMYGATAGQIGIIKDRMTTNQAVLAVVIIDKQKVFYEYLYYSLSEFVVMLLSNLQGSGQPNLSKNIIDSLLIPLPPLPEQQRIAEILSQIDQTIEKEEHYKEKLQNIKQGLMEDLLTGKVRVNHLVEEEEK